MSKKSLPTSKAKTAYGLLSEVRRVILAEPRRYDQEDWSRSYGGNLPPCGTVCCVGGWVETLKYGTAMSSEYNAEEILGIDDEQAKELFSGSAVDGIPQTSEHARNGAKHIAAFQQKYAKQLKAKAV